MSLGRLPYRDLFQKARCLLKGFFILEEGSLLGVLLSGRSPESANDWSGSAPMEGGRKWRKHEIGADIRSRGKRDRWMGFW